MQGFYHILHAARGARCHPPDAEGEGPVADEPKVKSPRLARPGALGNSLGEKCCR